MDVILLSKEESTLLSRTPVKGDLQPGEMFTSMIATNRFPHTLFAITSNLSVFQIYPFIAPRSMLNRHDWKQSCQIMHLHSPQALAEFGRAWEKKEMFGRIGD